MLSPPLGRRSEPEALKYNQYYPNAISSVVSFLGQVAAEVATNCRSNPKKENFLRDPTKPSPKTPRRKLLNAKLYLKSPETHKAQKC